MKILIKKNQEEKAVNANVVVINHQNKNFLMFYFQNN